MQNITALQLAIQANIPVFWWGEPGIGKTSIIHETAEALGWPLHVHILSTSDPTDIGGLPIVDDHGRFERRLSGTMNSFLERVLSADGGILFLDELSTAPPAVQAVALRVTQADPYGFRWMGDTRLPQHLRVVAAGNPPESSGGWELSYPLANRFYHHFGPPTTDAWIKGMRQGFSVSVARLAEDWEERIPVYKAYIAAFIHTRPTLLQVRPKEFSKPSPSRRTWDIAARLMAAGHAHGPEVQITLLNGVVGEGPASEFINWLTKMDLPKPEDVLEDPTVLRDDSPEHKTYAVLSGLMSYVAGHPSLDNWNKLWDVLVYVGKWSADVVFAFVRELILDVKPRVEAEVSKKAAVDSVMIPSAGGKLIKRVADKLGL